MTQPVTVINTDAATGQDGLTSATATTIPARIREEGPPIKRLRGPQPPNPNRMVHRPATVIPEKVTKFNFGAYHNIYIVKMSDGKITIYLADELSKPGVNSTWKIAELNSV